MTDGMCLCAATLAMRPWWRDSAQYHPRAILNFAAESHMDHSNHRPGEFIHTNIVGTFQLLEAVRAYCGGLDAAERPGFRLLHVSTDELVALLRGTD
jgi:dTDP-glucose 4,6-dehydratase